MKHANNRIRGQDKGDILVRALAEASSSIVVTDWRQPNNPIILVSHGFTELTGYEPAEVIGRNCRFLQGPGSDPETVSEIHAAICAGTPIRRSILNYRKNGEAFWNELALDPVRDDAGAVMGFVGVQNDGSVKRKAIAERMEAESHLDGVIRNIPGYVYRRVAKPDGSVEIPYFSASARTILGLPADRPPVFDDFLQRFDSSDLKELDEVFLRSKAELTPVTHDFRLIVPGNEPRWFRTVATPRREANGDTVWDGLAIDVNAEKSHQARLAFLAYHDPLTGLPNGVLFRESLSKAIATRAGKTEIAIFQIDLDGFQEINDALGQPAGDTVLRAVGHRLIEFGREAAGTAARLGGDDFAFLSPQVPPDKTVLTFAQTIIGRLTAPIMVAGSEILLDVSIGALSFPKDGDAPIDPLCDVPGELMKRADLALNAAKQGGRGTIRLYSAELDDRVRDALALRQSLTRAVAESQFVLHYQPLVELSSGRIVGAEALVRWEHPTLGMQRPDVFIPLAEESGLIVPLGAWVMREAMRQVQAWKRQGLEIAGISINVSGVQLKKPGFMESVERALAETGADPKDFKLELTEGTLIEATPQLFQLLGELKSRGFQLMIDDFGTGHSSFRYLRDFPVDMIKIDQTFIRHLVLESSDATIVRAIISLSRNLGMDAIAEGIETNMQRDFLRDEGCKFGQGYLFSLPLAAEDFGWLVQQRVTLPMVIEQ